MHEIIVQNLITSGKSERDPLYFSDASRGVRPMESEGPGLFEIDAGGCLNLCSFFNGFFPANYVEQGGHESFHANLEVEGRGRARLMTAPREGEPAVVEEREFAGPGTLGMSFRVTAKEARSIYYFEIEAGDAPAKLVDGKIIALVDDAPPEVRLGVVICTFRKEDYVRETAAALRNSRSLGNSVRVVIADNGKTLDPADFPGATVLPNPNYGGAGGFTRGMREVLQDDSLTHILFMDDDIELEPEVVFRSAALHRLLPENTGLSGAMLDMLQPTVMHEAGGFFDGNRYEFRARRHDLPLSTGDVLKTLQDPVPFSYGAFWYFSFKKTYAEDLGLIMPFFIRGDDMEFGHRLREAGAELVHQPGIAVWHEPFYAKEPVWIDYYTYRNCTFLAARYFKNSPLRTAFALGMELLRRLMLFRYGAAEFMLRGLRAFLKGPDVLTEKRPDELHMELIQSSKHDPDMRADAFADRERALAARRSADKPADAFGRVLYKLTLNGHFLPPFMTRAEPGYYDGTQNHGIGIRNILLRESIHQVGRIPERDVVRSMNRRRGFRVLLGALGILTTIVFAWNRKAAPWRTAQERLTSPDFWDEYMPII